MVIERLLGYALEEIHEKLGICKDFVDCLKKCIKQGKSLKDCLEECQIRMIDKHGLPLDYEVYDECINTYLALGLDFEEILHQELLKKKGD